MASVNETREAGLNELGKTTYDLLVIGGGITGCGVARDAALRGLKVALVEKDDFASGTSSKSSKLIHGGVRYLEHAQFKLVFEGTNERALLLRLAPHLVRPLKFMMPAYKESRPGLIKLDVGLWIYDALSKFRPFPVHKTYRAKALQTLEPLLNQESLKGSIVYHDCMTDDARLTLENAIDARALGARVLNHARVEKMTKDAQGRFDGAQVVCAESGKRVLVKAKVLLSGAGPWTDQVRKMAGHSGFLKPTKGIHLIVDRARLPIHHALVMLARRDHRVTFAIPWEDRTVLGTTDTFFDGNPDKVYATRDDVQYMLETANHYYPTASLKLEDVLSTWAGLRPLVAPESGSVDTSDISREHHILDEPGLVTVAGGKLTTYRRIAAEAVDKVVKQLGKPVASSTAERSLPGAV
ncbi:MAG: glycerol-3-phosphate dehydrogenase/oxidase, partial [Myxococcaceae bacterium]